MFHRMIRLEARRGSGTVWDAEPFFVTDSLRIHVEMEMTMAQQISQASVSIYNLSLDNAKALCGADHEPASLRNAEEKAEPRRVQIRILAGYRDEAMVDGDLPGHLHWRIRGDVLGGVQSPQIQGCGCGAFP